MTKLEEKLIELGYEEIALDNIRYFKWINDWRITFVLNKDNETYQDYFIAHKKDDGVRTLEDIYQLMFTFNEMQKDLEVLKEYENS